MTTQTQVSLDSSEAESAMVGRCHAHLAKLDPNWLERMDDTHLPTTGRQTVVELMQTAPDDFARGLMYGQMLARLELAQATGHPFV